MTKDKVFKSLQECRAEIECDFGIDLSSNIKTCPVLLRGESHVYEKSESSMKRLLTAGDDQSIVGYYFAQPFIDFEDVYAEYHSEKHGLSHEEAVGFLQHYGFPTDLLDVTPSFDTARFFACYEKEDKPVGILGVFDKTLMEEYFSITDLSKDPIADRPRNQNAYVARPGPGLHDLKGAVCDAKCSPRWYRFVKSKEDFAYVEEKKRWIYPSKEEIAYFFGKDLDDYFRHHANYEAMTADERRRVFEKLEKIRMGLGNTSRANAQGS